MLLECHHHLFALFFLYATCWIFQKLSTYKSEDCCCYRGRNSYFKRDKTARCEQIISVDKRRWCMLYKSRTICSALLHFALFHPQHFCCVWLRNHFIQFIHFALKKYLKCLNKKFLSCFYFSYVLLFNTYNLNTMTFNRAKLLISIHTFFEECFFEYFYNPMNDFRSIRPHLLCAVKSWFGLWPWRCCLSSIWECAACEKNILTLTVIHCILLIVKIFQRTISLWRINILEPEIT